MCTYLHIYIYAYIHRNIEIKFSDLTGNTLSSGGRTSESIRLLILLQGFLVHLPIKGTSQGFV